MIYFIHPIEHEIINFSHIIFADKENYWKIFNFNENFMNKRFDYYYDICKIDNGNIDLNKFKKEEINLYLNSRKKRYLIN